MTSEALPQASIIIPLWNGKYDIEACLTAVFQQTGASFEVIVVDNASMDGSADLVNQHFPQVRLIRNTTNLGFSGGVNVGLREASGNILLLLNQDTEVFPGWLSALVTHAGSPGAGVLGSKALYPDGTVQHAGGQVDARGAASHIGTHQADDGRWDEVKECDYVSGASMAIPRTVYRAVGGFDEMFSPAYYEDVDYCYRVRQAGFSIDYVPASRLIHKEASVSGTQDYDGIVRYHRNRLRFVLAHWESSKQGEFYQAEALWLANLENPELIKAHLTIYREFLWALYSSDKALRISDARDEWEQTLSRLAILTAKRQQTGYIRFRHAENTMGKVAATASKRLKVLVINPSFPPVGYLGGAEISCYHTTKALQDRGMQVRVLSVNTRARQTAEDDYAFDGIPVKHVTYFTKHRTHLADAFDVRVYHAVLDELRRFEPDIVHMHNASGTSLAPYVACQRENVPVVTTLHDLWLLCPNNMLYRKDGSLCDTAKNPGRCSQCMRKFDFWANVPRRRDVFKWLTRDVRYFIAPTEALMARHIEAGYAPERFVPVRLGFNAQMPAPPVDSGVRDLLAHHDPSKPLVLFTGGGGEIKGVQTVIEALPVMFSHIEGLRVIVAGGGEAHYLNDLRAMAPLVSVLGKVPFTDIRYLMAMADLVLVPSIVHENSPVTIFESFQVGTPVAGSNYGGIPELIDSHRTGYLFPRGRPDMMASRVIEHFSRPSDERRQMRQNCFHTVSTELSIENHIDAVLAVYAKALV